MFAELSSLFAEEFGRGIGPTRRAAIEAQFLVLRPEQFRQMYDSARLLVEQVDFESLFALSGLPRLDTARILANLIADGVISS